MNKLTDENIDDVIKLIDASVLSEIYKVELVLKLDSLRTAKIIYSMNSPKDLNITYPFQASDETGNSVTVVGYSDTVGWIIKGSCKDNINTHYFLRNIYME